MYQSQYLRLTAGLVSTGLNYIYALTLTAGSDTATLQIYDGTTLGGYLCWTLKAAANTSQSVTFTTPIEIKRGMFIVLSGTSPVAYAAVDWAPLPVVGVSFTSASISPSLSPSSSVSPSSSNSPSRSPSLSPSGSRSPSNSPSASPSSSLSPSNSPSASPSSSVSPSNSPSKSPSSSASPSSSSSSSVSASVSPSI